MEARGLPPDSVAHTILVMAHEKAGAWREALAAYRHMRDRGLERNSFTYRRALAGSGPGPAFLWAGGGAAAGGSAGRNPQSGCQASPVSPRLASPAHAACLCVPRPPPARPCALPPQGAGVCPGGRRPAGRRVRGAGLDGR